MNALQDSNDSKIKKIRIEVIYDFALIFFSCIHLKHYGTLQSKNKIPTEIELCSQSYCSRMTASKALNHLVQEGHIVQKHGKGGFAASLAVHKHVSQFSIFTDDMRSIDNASCSASKNGHGRTKVITHSLFHKSERDKV